MTVIQRVLVDEAIKLDGCDARLDVRSDEVHQLRVEPTGSSQTFTFVLIVNRNLALGLAAAQRLHDVQPKTLQRKAVPKIKRTHPATTSAARRLVCVTALRLTVTAS